MKVWLTKKLAERIDDVPLIGLHVGDTLDVATRQAELLLAEGWAALERRIRSYLAVVEARLVDQL